MKIMENKLPKNWTSCDLKTVVISRKGKKPSTVSVVKNKGFVPYILIDEMEGKEPRAYTDDKKVVIANEKDVLVVWDGSIGKTATGLTGAIGSTIVGLSPVLINHKYLEAYIKYKNPYIHQTSKGTGLQHISQDYFWTMPFPLAPLNEQNKIHEKLDRLMARVVDSKERLDKIPLILKRFKQSVLQSAFNGGLTKEWREKNKSEVKIVKAKDKFKLIKELGDKSLDYSLSELPKGWQWLSITDICEVRGGKRIPKGHKLLKSKTDFPYIKAGALKNGTVIDEKIEYLNPETQKIIKRYIVNKGDVYITNVGACIGDAGIIPVKYDGANLTENAVKMTDFNNEIFNEYLSLWMQSPTCQGYIKDTILSAAQGKLALGRIKLLPFPYAPKVEQIEIVKAVHSLLNKIEKIEKNYLRTNRFINFLPQSIYAKAFRGELVEQDPNDEPAEVLLEKIRKAKKGKR